MQETVLADLHRSLGARMIPFAGWDMPVIYQDIVSEHLRVRRSVGVFDLCHMGRIRFQGPDAVELAARVQTGDARRLPYGKTRYALICHESGGIVDDILISRESNGFLCVVNASNRAADLTVFRDQARDLHVDVLDHTDDVAMIAVQGPCSAEALAAVGLPEAQDVGYYKFVEVTSAWGDLILSRTGYTGELGFEVFLPRDRAVAFFRELLEAGKPWEIAPCGLGARDTLRLEAGMPLYGHEIDHTVNPYEAGLGFAVRSKDAFVGSKALRSLAGNVRRQLVGLLVDGPRIPRQGYEVFALDRLVGTVCSGTLSPSLEKNIATALVEKDVAESDTPLEIMLRRHRAPAVRTPLPFYRRKD